MRFSRSSRTSALRVTAAAASGVFAMAALTGCLGDDDKDKATGTGATKAPTASAEASAEPSGKADPSAKSTGTGKPSTGKPTSTSTSSQVEAVVLAAGECIDTSATGDISKKPCTGPHGGEVGAVLTIPDSRTPTSMTYKKDNEAACEAAVMPIIDRQPNAKDLSFSYYSPTVSSWMQDNDRTLQCIIVRADKAKLTAKLK
ncbi:hypothetical protein [Yinghuangia soli]|uniref:Septum formation-related domain-containing protein n=1 Tax=Yinghuangia soli TaxID=2908204 RepID=A0AA41PZD7_9ACTN|nr:hypothetical protein [Yinghuangia soli]MCF2527619.1 hypothetical protein [Yinghuangia soli]